MKTRFCNNWRTSETRYTHHLWKRDNVTLSLFLRLTSIISKGNTYWHVCHLFMINAFFVIFEESYILVLDIFEKWRVPVDRNLLIGMCVQIFKYSKYVGQKIRWTIFSLKHLILFPLIFNLTKSLSNFIYILSTL